MKDRRIALSLVACTLGFMLAIQFQTTNHPKKQDKRDIWQLRSALEEEKKKQMELNKEVEKNEELLNDYQSRTKEYKLLAMKEALKDLKTEAGLTKKSGQGILIRIEPFNEELSGKIDPAMFPALLERLVNELNRYEAKDISINGERIISRSSIRLVNGKTYVNNEPISTFPIIIRVIAKDPKKLKSQIIASQSAEDFVRENLNITSKPVKHLTLPPYSKPIRVNYMKQVKEG
ncbi:DUF881 domain-containing protein [Fictibacillus sp. Mic-4]|uniref:DUF881 domain-containing protein n=1 Tax=Fictibacillus TaxID=1329200 RepID=UPI0009D643D8|nr:DUF881 domain-containing protein [Fictibacillus gelatini]